MRKTAMVIGIVGIVLAVLFIARAHAQGPSSSLPSPVLQGQVAGSGDMINFQGQLYDATGQPVPPGSYTMLFTICRDGINYEQPQYCRDTSVWSGSFTVEVDGQGLFSVLLPGLDASKFTDNRWLMVEVNGEWMNPNQPITSVALSMLSVGNIRKNMEDESRAVTNGSVLKVVNEYNGRGLDGESIAGIGVYASGGAYGVWADSSPIGVYGTGSTYGIQGVSDATAIYGYSQDGRGVYGESLTGKGVRGHSLSGWGVYGTSSESNGVYGLSNSDNGVLGVCAASEDGVHGHSTSGAGVKGESTGGAAVVANSLGFAGDLFQGFNPSGMQFQVTNDGTINNLGSLNISGTQSAIVNTTQGQRALYAVESPEVWFEDFGSAALVNGQVTVTIDLLFAETVNLTETYYVFPVPQGDCQGLYIAVKSPSFFVVRELGGGQSNITFDYRIVAKRTGYETTRMPIFNMPQLPPPPQETWPQEEYGPNVRPD